MTDLLIVDVGINQMNDTMKLALGVTGFASLLVLAVPSNFDVSKAEDKVQNTHSPDPQKALAPRPIASAPRTEVIVADDEDEDFSFGDPIASTDPIDFDDFDSDNNVQDNSAVTDQSNFQNKVHYQPSPVAAAKPQKTEILSESLAAERGIPTIRQHPD